MLGYKNTCKINIKVWFLGWIQEWQTGR